MNQSNLDPLGCWCGCNIKGRGNKSFKSQVWKNILSGLSVYFFFHLTEYFLKSHQSFFLCIEFRERNIDLLFHLFTDALLYSCMWPDPVSNQQPWCIRTKLYSTKLSSQSYTSLSIACIAFTPNNQMNYRYSMNICWDSLNIRHLPGTTPCDSPCRNKALKEHSLWWRQWNLYIGFYRIKTTGKKDSKVFIEVVLWVMETMGSPPFFNPYKYF